MQPGAYAPGYTDRPPATDKKPRTSLFNRRARNMDNEQPPVTRRVAGLNRNLAIIFAGLTFLLVIFLIISSGSSKTTFVLRAKVALAAGAALTADNTEVVALPDEAIEPGAVTGTDRSAMQTDSLKTFANLLTRQSMPAGRQLHRDDLTGSLLTSGAASPDMRAMSLKVAYGDALAGLIGVGDHVDIIGVATGTGLAAVVAQVVKIIAVSSSEAQLSSAAEAQSQDTNRSKPVSDLLPTKPLPGIYTVEVKSDLVTTLAGLSSQGSLVFVLRGPKANAEDPAVTDPVTALCALAQFPKPAACKGS